MARTEIERLGLGRLERLDLKSFWGEQLPDLTPWFLQNIDLLERDPRDRHHAAGAGGQRRHRRLQRARGRRQRPAHRDREPPRGHRPQPARPDDRARLGAGRGRGDLGRAPVPRGVPARPRLAQRPHRPEGRLLRGGDRPGPDRPLPARARARRGRAAPQLAQGRPPPGPPAGGHPPARARCRAAPPNPAGCRATRPGPADGDGQGSHLPPPPPLYTPAAPPRGQHEPPPPMQASEVPLRDQHDLPPSREPPDPMAPDTPSPVAGPTLTAAPPPRRPLRPSSPS